MTRLAALMGCFRDDESGAAMIEYTIFFGLVSATLAGLCYAASPYVTGFAHGYMSRLTAIFPQPS
jgi:Flp pilus assembly pilin Flp